MVYDYDAGLQGYNLFVYCGNNPINRIDISGANSTDLLDGEKGDEEHHDDSGGHKVSPTPSPGDYNGSNPSRVGSGGANSVPAHSFGFGKAPKQADAGSVYTQISSDGTKNIVSETTYNELGMPEQRIDFSGKAHHGIVTPHIHYFQYIQMGENVYRCGEKVLPYHRIK